MTEGLVSPLVSPWDVEQAVLGTLKTWLPSYLAEIEKERGLQPRSLERPPTPESYHGNTGDMIAWVQDELPAVITVVEAVGEPELSASAGYTQCYQVEVWCVVMGDDGVQQVTQEDSARLQASHYGAATMLLVQQSELQNLPGLQWLKMVGLPRVECPEPEKRREQAAITTFHVWISSVVDPNSGPVGPTPQESPEYGGEPEAPFKEDPTVSKTGTTVDGVPITSKV